MKKIARWILRLAGWKIETIFPQEKKYVLIVAPHTSAWDFVIGRLAFCLIGIPAKVIIKKEFFFFPIKRLLRALGGLPVDRQHPQGMIRQIAEIMEKSEQMALIITPEGTRKKNPHWKKGFYFIAQQANVSIYIGRIDYKTKTGGIVKKLDITGNYDEDFKQIREIYKDAQGKYPDRFAC